MSDPATADPTGGLYRPNVGVVLFHRDGRVWLGRRVGLNEGVAAGRIWQFPQGGVDPGEDLIDAARRELAEETGVTSVSFLEQAPGFITYDFPANFGGSKAARGFKGQRQAWFAFRFEGEDGEIDLEAHGEVEFDAWRWGTLEEAQALVVEFKREAYAQVIAAFRHLAAGGVTA